MSAADSWRSVFENWPAAIPRQGIVTTSFQESVSFVDFLISPGIVLLERDRPDSVGARKIMLPYENIAAVKITATMELARFQVMGFQAPF